MSRTKTIRQYYKLCMLLTLWCACARLETLMARVDSIYRAVGKRIRLARKNKGFTQETLSERVSLTRTSITNIEQGRQKLLVHSLYVIANVLGVHPGDLLPNDEELVTDNIDQRIPVHLAKKEKNWISSVIEGGGDGGSKKNN